MATATPSPGNGTVLAPIEAQLPPLGFGERVLLTLALLAAFGVTLWITRYVRRTVDAGDRERELNASLALGVIVVGVSLALLAVSLWASDLARFSAFSFLNVRNPAQSAIQAIVTVLLVVGVYVFTGFVKDFIHGLAEDTSALTQHQTELLFRSTQVALYGLALLLVFGIWNVNLGGLLVGAGFLGIVVGLAARQTLGSLIAGFVLMFARPFEIGDWVQIGEREGLVTEISIVNTRIQTFDGEYAMIPNDTVGSSEIVNRTRKGRLRIRVEVGVDYDTDLQHAVDTATEAMRDVDDILTVPQPQVVLKEFSNSAITLELRFWIDKPSSRRRWRAQTAVIQAVKGAFEREGIKIPFPQRELMGRIEEGGFRLADGEAGRAIPPEPTTDGGAGSRAEGGMDAGSSPESDAGPSDDGGEE
ncbi:MAG: mechanosensitive ion channel family protein [Halobacteriales archaeon]